LAAVLDSYTNTWTADTAFPLGATNYFATSGEATLGVIGIATASTSTARFGVLDLVATGDITFTNEAGFRTSDFLDSRVITNGNTAQILVNYIPGQTTNMAIVQFR